MVLHAPSVWERRSLPALIKASLRNQIGLFLFESNTARASHSRLQLERVITSCIMTTHRPGTTNALTVEVALKFLESAREDFRQRLELKQTLMTLYLAGVAGIVGFVYRGGAENPTSVELLLVVPLLSLGAAAFIGNHLLVIAALVRYSIDELEPHLAAGNVRLWEESEALHMLSERTGSSLHVNELILICLPAVASIVAFSLRVLPTLRRGGRFEIIAVGVVVCLDSGWCLWLGLRYVAR
jgi:hypothetical protein